MVPFQVDHLYLPYTLQSLVSLWYYFNGFLFDVFITLEFLWLVLCD
jgi:hypothetical protein